MAKKNNTPHRVNYLPLDMDIFEQKEIIVAQDLVDEDGTNPSLRLALPYVCIQLQMEIFRRGYYLPWDNYTIITTAAIPSIKNLCDKHGLINIVDALCKSGFLSEKMMQKQGILTSYSLQQKYINHQITYRRTYNDITKEYVLYEKKTSSGDVKNEEKTIPLSKRISKKLKPGTEEYERMRAEFNALVNSSNKSLIQKSSEDSDNLLRISQNLLRISKTFRRLPQNLQKVFVKSSEDYRESSEGFAKSSEGFAKNALKMASYNEILPRRASFSFWDFSFSFFSDNKGIDNTHVINEGKKTEKDSDFQILERNEENVNSSEAQKKVEPAAAKKLSEQKEILQSFGQYKMPTIDDCILKDEDFKMLTGRSQKFIDVWQKWTKYQFVAHKKFRGNIFIKQLHYESIMTMADNDEETAIKMINIAMTNLWANCIKPGYEPKNKIKAEEMRQPDSNMSLEQTREWYESQSRLI